MKRLRRILFNTLTAISLLLAIAMAGLWVRSDSHADWVEVSLWERRAFILASKRGSLTILGFRSQGSIGQIWLLRSFPADHVMSFPVGDQPAHGNALGFGRVVDPTYFVMNPIQQTPNGPVYVLGAATATLKGSGLVLPYWALFTPLCIGPALRALVFVRRVRRTQHGHCPACGYDMRANPTRCSECGREATAA